MSAEYSLDSLRAAIDLDELKELLKSLISIQSHGGVPDYEEKAAQHLCAFLNDRGIPAALSYAAPHRPNLLAELPGRDERRALLLTGHLDTVGDYGVPGLFEAREHDGSIYGRGACDMKGPIACMVEAALAARRMGAELPCSLKLAFVADEEFKSIGTEHLIEQGLRADAAVLGEPTNMAVCLGNRGLEWVDINVHGRQTHGGTPQKGVNAVLMAARLIERIQRDLVPRLRERTHPVLGSAIMNFGVVRGGFQPSTVPAECLIKIDRRWLYGESVQQVYDEFQEIIDAMSLEVPGFSATLSRDLTNLNKLEHGPVCLDENHPVAQGLHGALELITGQKADSCAFPGWTDASLLTNFGHIPTAIFGPGDIACAHTERECVEIAQLRDAAAVYLHTALHFKPEEATKQRRWRDVVRQSS